jgi:hypothetical protein
VGQNGCEQIGQDYKKKDKQELAQPEPETHTKQRLEARINVIDRYYSFFKCTLQANK